MPPDMLKSKLKAVAGQLTARIGTELQTLTEQIESGTAENFNFSHGLTLLGSGGL